MTQSSPLSPQSSIPSRWLITGGCGFIGLNLIKSLIDEGGHYIRIIDNLTVGSREDLSAICKFTDRSPQSSFLSPDSSLATQVDLIIGDILDADLALKAAQDIDVIVHLAANTGVGPSVEDPRIDCETNVIGTLNYLEAARFNHVKRFIFASSGAPAGEIEPPIHEEIAPHPVSPYGASKLAGEGYCSAYYRTFGVETVALRFGNVYGPLSGHKNSVVAKFIKQAMDGKPLEIYGDGNQIRDFIYINYLIRAIRIASVATDAGGEVFQIATNKETAVSELTEQLLAILVDSGCHDIEVCYSEPRSGDVRRNFSDTSKAKKILGWQARVPLAEGLRQTVNWFIK